MIYISYYTKNTPYANVVQTYLLPSLKKYNLSYRVEGIEDLGSWQKNTHFKAEFILKQLLKHKQPVVFLDADASIEQYPILFEQLENYDIALHFLDWYLHWHKQSGQTKREVLSGTFYLAYNKRVLKFLDEWIELNKTSQAWEQKNLETVLKSRKNKLQIYELPPHYCAIILHNNQLPEHYLNGKEVVILHHQISRKFRNV